MLAEKQRAHQRRLRLNRRRQSLADEDEEAGVQEEVKHQHEPDVKPPNLQLPGEPYEDFDADYERDVEGEKAQPASDLTMSDLAESTALLSYNKFVSPSLRELTSLRERTVCEVI